MVEIIEEALLHLSDRRIWKESDQKFGKSVTRKIRNNLDLTTKERIRAAVKLKKYSSEFPNWKQLSRKLREWKKVQVSPDMIRLPRLDFDGKDFLLYVGIKQIGAGLIVPDGKRRTNSLVWKYSAGSEKAQELDKTATKNKWIITADAKKRIILKLEQIAEKQKSIDNVQRLKESTDIPFDLPLKTVPYEHQKKAMAIGIELNRSALLMEQGTGKTLSAIGVAAHRFMQGQIKRLLIVAPKSVLPEWAMQVEEHTDLPYKAVPLDMKTKQKQAVFNDWEDLEGALNILTINYESLNAFEKEILKWSPDMIIMDESQKIKNPSTVQAKTIYRIADKCNVEYRMILTGTPVSETPLDFFGQYRFLDSSIFGHSFTSFKTRYANFDYWGRKILSYNHEEELASKAHSIAFRITKKDANLNLPEEKSEILNVILDKDEQKAYDDMEETAVLQLSHDLITAPLMVTQLMKLQQITGGFIKDEDGVTHHIGNSKMEALKQVLAPRIQNKQKTVIFCKFVSEIGLIHEWLGRLGTRHEVLMGSTKDRGGTLTRFKSDPENLVFLAQIKAGGVGITLTAADMAIFFSTGYSLIDYEQAKARIHRIGQTKPVTYLHLLGRGTIDKVIYRALSTKKSTADLFVDHMKYITNKTEEEHLMAKLEERLDGLKNELNAGVETEESVESGRKSKRRRGKSNTGEATEMAKDKKEKAVKEPKEKKEKVVKEPVEKKETVSLAEIAEEMGTTPAELRKHLRKSDIEKPGGGWSWEPGHADIARVKALDLTPAPKKSKKADEDEAAE